MLGSRRWSAARWLSSDSRRTSPLRRKRPIQVEPLEDRRLLAAGGNEQLTGLFGFEPAVAVDPNNPDVVAVAQFRTVNISRDGGLTFPTSVTVTAPNGYAGGGGDPTLSFDNDGLLYYGYLASNPAPANANFTLGVFNAVINPQTGAILQNQTIALETNTTQHDKEWVAADAWEGSPFRNNAYMVWSRLGGTSRILFSRTTNGGAGWSAPAILSSNGQGFVWPSEVSVAPNGDVWVGWHTNTANTQGNLGGIILRKSSDGGATFQPDLVPFPNGTADINDNAPPNAPMNGLQAWMQGSVQPRILLDPVRPGNIYVICADDPDNNYAVGDTADIVMARSTDNGATWTRSTISHAPFGTIQVMPAAYIDEEGNFAVSWYDTRRGLTSVGPDQVPGNGDDNLLLDVYVTVSRDGGLTFSNDFRVNEQTFDPDRGPPTDRFPPNQVFRIGEYNGHQADSDLAFVAWTANSGNAQDISFDVFSMASAFSDRFEANNTRATATNLGSPPSLTLDDLTIDPGDTADDQDFFRWRAAFTGTLDLGIRFTHRAGNLDLRVLDSNGNVIVASTSTDNDERVFIPVVAGQDYTFQVVGVNGNTNSYSLELQNDPAPVPIGVTLEAASDTGMSNTDNITADNTPTIFIQADLSYLASQGIDILDPAEVTAKEPGAAVEVFSGGVSRGFATSVAGSDNTLFTFTFTAGQLAQGTNFIQAAVRMYDGKRTGGGAAAPATGRTQLSPPLVLTLDTVVPSVAGGTSDLLPSSDTGMFDDDDVTNIQQPAYAGLGPANTMVRVRANGNIIGEGFVGSDASDGNPTNGLGVWEITTEPVADGSYIITVDFEDKAGNRATLPFPHLLVVDTQDPNRPYLDLVDASDSGRHNTDDVTNDNTPTVTSTSFDANPGDSPLAHLIKYRIFDRLGTGPEVLLVDSFVTQGDLVPAGLFTDVLPLLADGVHNLKLEVEDRAGNISPAFLLSVTIDTQAPPAPVLLVEPPGDTGVGGQAATLTDRLTRDATTRFTGYSEADSLVRLYADGLPISELQLSGSDVFVGLTTAVPLDGNGGLPLFSGAPAPGQFNGQFNLTPTRNLNDNTLFNVDGRRQMFARAEDLAGNLSPGSFAVANPAVLDMFLDTAGPRVNGVTITNAPAYNLFDFKPSAGPTPLVRSLDVRLIDLPSRVLGWNYPAVNPVLAATIGNYSLVGDHVGTVAITQAEVLDQTVVPGPGVTMVRLHFAQPLADDRYTLVLSDRLTDNAGNALDGESSLAGPFDVPDFPSGDGQAGGDFRARFTIDTRPEIATYSEGSVYVDINGNFVFDEEGQDDDGTNRDLVFSLGFATDALFAGNFDVAGVANGYDKLGAYGKVGGDWRWLVDLDGDGDIDLNVVQPAILGLPLSVLNALPVAGNFDGNAANGDEVGLFDGVNWMLDSNANDVIDAADTIILGGSLVGFPIVGDFDGDGLDDLGAYDNGPNRFYFDFAGSGGLTGAVEDTIDFSFTASGRVDRPVAADMDRDGIDDLGLWIPGRQGQTPREEGEWYFLLSNDFRVPGGPIGEGGGAAAAVAARIVGQADMLDHPFNPAPLGQDMFAQYGDEFAIPLVGNFDPPLSAAANGGTNGTDTVGFYDPTPGAGVPFWFVKNTASAGLSDQAFQYGPPGSNWVPLFGDWNGDGVDTIGFYDSDNSRWFLKNSLGQGVSDVTFNYGPAGARWFPLVGDWDGDGDDSVGLFDPVTATWFLKNQLSQGVSDVTFRYGPTNPSFNPSLPVYDWIPISGDWDANGVDGAGFFHQSAANWFLKNGQSQGLSDVAFSWGPSGTNWLPLWGDWNADGFDSVGLYDPSQARWFLKNTNSQGLADSTFVYGVAGSDWLPLFGDWDGASAGGSSAFQAPASLEAEISAEEAAGLTETDGQAEDPEDVASQLVFASGGASGDIVTEVSAADDGFIPRAPAAATASIGTDGVGFFDTNPFDAQGVLQPSWFTKNTFAQGLSDQAFAYGEVNNNWFFLRGDWDGDGLDTVGFYDTITSTWFLKNSLGQGVSDIAFVYGLPRAAWQPVIGDWDGDGRDSIGFYDPITANWFLKNELSAGLSDVTFSYGPPDRNFFRNGRVIDFRPLAGDWDGDGIDGPGFYQQSTATWFLKNSQNQGLSDLEFNWGVPNSGWYEVTGDWNADGIDTPGLYDWRTATWLLKNDNAPGPHDISFNYGPAGDRAFLPMSGDWNGPGQPLRLAGPSGHGAPALIGAEAAGVLDAALGRWGAAGLATGQLAGVQLEITDLPGDLLGLAEGQTVYLDRDAAGHGWFVDPTPHDDAEFAGGRAVDPQAVDRIDLLSVVAHELGHLAGEADRHDPSEADDVMFESLARGARRLPSAAAIDRVLAGR